MEITTLLQAAQSGDADCARKLTDIIYARLHEIAGSQLRREYGAPALQPTELVNEAYLRLFHNAQIEWKDRSHFFAIAAVQMRRILIEQGRRRGAAKRAGIQISLTEAGEPPDQRHHVFGDVERLLSKLERQDPTAARVVELKIYGGFTDDEIAQREGVPKSKVRADWSFARSWLASRLTAKNE